MIGVQYSNEYPNIWPSKFTTHVYISYVILNEDWDIRRNINLGCNDEQISFVD